MAFTIAILAQKGGTRKSTLARALSVAYTKGGWNTLLADLDANQATAGRWGIRRESRDIQPAINLQVHPVASSALQARDDYDMVILDGKGFASAETAVLAQAADLILIPSGNGLDDLEPSVTLAMLLVEKHGVDPSRILFPLTNMGKSLAEIADARTYLEKAGFQASPGYLSVMTCYGQAHDQGRAVTETSAPGPKKQANDWIRGIIERVDQLVN